MKATLEKLFLHQKLSREEAKTQLLAIGRGEVNAAQIAAFLTVYRMRSMNVEELAGFRDALLDLCVAIDLSAYDPIDLCGTGGDGKDTFNISTLASFVTAGAGVPVAKHGNYGVSSGCGSSNVLEAQGIRFSNEVSFLEKCIAEAGICILHAPLFHPAMKHVAPIRRELGLKTFFNMLGPLVNPAKPQKQLVGVYDVGLMRLYGQLLAQTNMQYTILHAAEGYDEISLTCDTHFINNKQQGNLSPEQFGLEKLNANEIAGGHDVPSSVAIFQNVLEGRGTAAQTQVVCANAAMAIATALSTSPIEGYKIAQESLLSGKALNAFKTLQKISAL